MQIELALCKATSALYPLVEALYADEDDGQRSKLSKKLPRREVLEPHRHERVVVGARLVQRRRRAVPGSPVVAHDDVALTYSGPVGN